MKKTMRTAAALAAALCLAAGAPSAAAGEKAGAREAERFAAAPVVLPLLPAPEHWQASAWGRLRLKDGALRFDAATNPYDGIACRATRSNVFYDFSALPPEEVALRLRLDRDVPVKVQVKNGGTYGGVELPGGVPGPDGTTVYAVPLAGLRLPTRDAVCEVMVQFPRPLRPEGGGGGEVKVAELAFVATQAFEPVRVDAPVVRALRERYRQPFRAADASPPRPVVDRGTWKTGDRYEFLLGPWIYGNENGDWGQGTERLGIDHPAYTTPPSAEVFRAVGFNSAQMSAASTVPGRILSGVFLATRMLESDALQRYYRRFESVPLALDFAFGYDKAFRETFPPERRAELEQQNPGWHAFIPLCPEHPEGKRYYRDYFQGGTRFALENGANVFAYELFNESNYQCRCRFNLEDFARAMKERHGTIARANAVWSTSFTGFDAAADRKNLRASPGIWQDWCSYSARRYAEVLREAAGWIREIDPRPGVLFTEQLSNVNVYATPGMGMDYRDIAGALDFLAIEGGWKYGQQFSPNPNSPWEAAAAEESSLYPYICDLFQAFGRGEKPVVNHEHYCARFEFGQRVPSRRMDMITSLWGEVFHGLSGSYSYAWDKRSFDWKTFEEAKANVLTPSYKSYSTLNPYNWPVEELDAFKIFMAELEPYRDRLLPQPRFKPATVGIFFSYPALRRLPFTAENFRAKMLNGYTALLYGQYPLAFLLDEELAGATDLPRALVFPAASAVTRASWEAAGRYLKDGGRIIADAGAFRWDEYGKALPPLAGDLVRVDMAKDEAVEAVRRALAEKSVPRYGAVESADGQPLASTEFQWIDRGDFKMAFLFNLEPYESRQATVRFFLDDDGDFHLSDVTARRLLAPEAGDTWSADRLRRGVTVVLPPQERLLLALERKRPDGFAVVRPAEVLALLEQAKTIEAKELERVAAERTEREQSAKAARAMPGVRTERCVPLDLGGVANRGFRDGKEGDGEGGWFDQGDNDFRNMPLGRQTLAGIPFHIVNPAANGGKGALILYSTRSPTLPKQAGPLPVSRRVEKVYLLHAYGWNTAKDNTVYSLVVTYADGGQLRVPMRQGREIGGWWGAAELPDAKIAVERGNAQTPRVNLQAAAWKNPEPQRTVASISFESGGTGAIPAIVAATVETAE